MGCVRPRAVQAPWRQLAMCSVCKLTRVAEIALAVFSKYDRCAAGPTLSLVEKLGVLRRSEQIKCHAKIKEHQVRFGASAAPLKRRGVGGGAVGALGA